MANKYGANRFVEKFIPGANIFRNPSIFKMSLLADDSVVKTTKYYAKHGGKEIEVVRATPDGLKALVAGAVQELGMNAEWAKHNYPWGDSLRFTQFEECDGYIPSNINAKLILHMIAPLIGYVEKNKNKIRLYLNEVEMDENGQLQKSLAFNLVLPVNIRQTGWSEKINGVVKSLDGTGVRSFGMCDILGNVDAAFNIPFFKSYGRSEP